MTQEHETDMPHCWCNPKKIAYKNGNIAVHHNNLERIECYRQWLEAEGMKMRGTGIGKKAPLN